ncbi:MAG: glycosyltransferase family 2 protein [Candidatus Magasanikbacteria bacterium]|nr:glycosyltransferase family 2 protein [Candidatus Magasanikbacteria bacterium]
MSYPKIAIIYLSFHSEPDLGEAVAAFKKITYPKDRLELIIVDNPHPEFGSSVRFIEETVLPLSGVVLPHVTILPQKTNLGFSGGNNAGMKWALEHSFDYIFLHNSDGFLAGGAMESLVNVLEQDKTIGAAQALLLLYPETDLVNSAGNSYHYLGIGYCGNFRVPQSQLNIAAVSETGYLSGAAVMLRASLLKAHGLWDDDFFLYHEDIEYSLRLKSLGYKIVVAREAIFFHKYNFSRNKQKFYYIERNRLGVIFMYYKLPTILLLLPAGIFWELGMLWFAVRQGWLLAKLKSYLYWLNPRTVAHWYKKRLQRQANRTISDRRLLAAAVSTISFPERSINSPLLRYIANPILFVYWKIVRLILWW